MVLCSLGFFNVVLHSRYFARSIDFLMFVSGLLVFCDVLACSECFPFFPLFDVVGTLHSSGHYFLAHWISSPMAQYLISS
jgi:hypothetical protein